MPPAARSYTHPRPLVAQRLAFGAMAVAGVAAAVTLSLASGDEGESEAAADPNCTEVDRRIGGVDGGGHPPKRFYGPGEEVPVGLFNHILLDGYVIVTYKPDLPEPDLEALEEWITARDIIVAAHPKTDQEEPVVASTVRNALACSELDLDALTAFRDDWFEARPQTG